MHICTVEIAAIMAAIPVIARLVAFGASILRRLKSQDSSLTRTW